MAEVPAQQPRPQNIGPQPRSRTLLIMFLLSAGGVLVAWNQNPEALRACLHYAQNDGLEMLMRGVNGAQNAVCALVTQVVDRCAVWLRECMGTIDQERNRLPPLFAQQVAAPVSKEWKIIVTHAMQGGAAIRVAAMHLLAVKASSIRIVLIGHAFLASYMGDQAATVLLVVGPPLIFHLTHRLVMLIIFVGWGIGYTVVTLWNWCRAIVDFFIWLIT